jgi:hypothetical protein
MSEDQAKYIPTKTAKVIMFPADRRTCIRTTKPKSVTMEQLLQFPPGELEVLYLPHSRRFVWNSANFCVHPTALYIAWRNREIPEPRIEETVSNYKR